VSKAPDWLRASAVALCGAFVGLAYAWLTRAQPPAEVIAVVDGQRVRTVHPVMVAPTPWWVYAALATLGAVMALIAVASLRSTARPIRGLVACVLVFAAGCLVVGSGMGVAALAILGLLSGIAFVLASRNISPSS
jgi:hypothetical protein